MECLGFVNQQDDVAFDPQANFAVEPAVEPIDWCECAGIALRITCIVLGVLLIVGGIAACIVFPVVGIAGASIGVAVGYGFLTMVKATILGITFITCGLC